jgi:putative membrane protein
MPRYQGGEGVRRLVETREKRAKICFMSIEYWDISLFSFRGRAWPMLPQVLYCLFSTVMTCIVINLVPNYQDVGELAALQFPISTLGTCLFLLLSFRTNSSYERWWEGRKLWDGMQTKVQDTARMALVWVAPLDKESASGLVRWALTYAYVAKKLLRVEHKYGELGGILSQPQIEELEESIDPATLVAERLTQLTSDAARKELHPALFSGLDANIRGLQADLSAMSRIASTPMPFAYIVHLRSFLILWLIGLPFAFVQTLKYWTILVCFVIGYQLLGTETIGVEIENPFGEDYNDLPLDQITTELYIKLAAVLSRLGQQVDILPAVQAAEESAAAEHMDGYD